MVVTRMIVSYFHLSSHPSSIIPPHSFTPFLCLSIYPSLPSFVFLSLSPTPSLPYSFLSCLSFSCLFLLTSLSLPLSPPLHPPFLTSTVHPFPGNTPFPFPFSFPFPFPSHVDTLPSPLPLPHLPSAETTQPWNHPLSSSLLVPPSLPFYSPPPPVLTPQLTPA